jgi:hypothetical protein
MTGLLAIEWQMPKPFQMDERSKLSDRKRQSLRLRNKALFSSETKV